MKRGLGGLFFICAVAFLLPSAYADGGIPPYFKVGTVDAPINDAAQKVRDALKGGGFDVIGSYSPEGKSSLMVIAYSRKDLESVTAKVKERGLLAAILKVGLKEDGGKTVVSMVNPEYLFRGYLMKNFAPNEEHLRKITGDAKQALQSVGAEFVPFGGILSVEDLKHYHYMLGMEYFEDPVFLRKFNSFEEGVQTITGNLVSKKGGAFAVFTLVNNDSQMAVFGVGLGDARTGEQFFLPIIGEDHLSALPYEVILNGKEATILHGRFRIALHWPALTMGTFTKIISTPGDIASTMKGLTK